MKTLLFLALFSFATAHAAEDPFLWLEEIDSKKSLDWVNEHNEKTLNVLKAQKLFATLEKDAKKIITSKDRLPNISLHNGKLYTFWQDDAHPRGLWQRTSIASYKTGKPKWEILLDLDKLNKKEGKVWVWKGADCLEPEHVRCMISLSPGGGDAVEKREFDLRKKAFVAKGFFLPAAKINLGWIDENTLFVGTDFGAGTISKSGYPLVSKRWKRGTPLEKAEEVFRGTTADTTAESFVVAQPGWKPEFRARYITFVETEINLVLPSGKTVRIPLPTNAAFQTVLGDRAMFLLRTDLKTSSRTFLAGSLVAYPLRKAEEGESSLNSLELIFAPTEKRFLSSAIRSGSSLLLDVLDNVRGKILKATPGAGEWKLEEIELGKNGMAGTSDASAFSDEFLATYEDFLTPTTQLLGRSSSASKPEKLRTSPSFFDASKSEVAQFEATSKDGTKIPYFMVSPKGMALDSSHPTLLYGYGGFEVPITPFYAGVVGKSWMEKGGVYVLANIRGGGEFGPAWHEAARQKNHQRVFDDFIAVAEDLIARKVTSPAHLGIQGGSNGGLLVGGTFVQRPDLFNAVVCSVPLLDMLRFHTLLAGNSWISEYGNPDEADMREAILKYSPYQNLKQGMKYPEVLFTTSTRDDRVHPGHARKMAALMESLGNKIYYYENTEGGHGGSSTPDQRARVMAIEFAYLWMKLGR